MANNNKSSLAASRTIPMILQYLKENGLEETFQTLQIESSMDYEKVSPNKPSLLMEALTVWDDVKSKEDVKSQEVTADQRADDALLLSRITSTARLQPVTQLCVSLDAVHKANVITARFMPATAGTSLIASGGADKLLKITDWKTQTVHASVDCKGPVLSLDPHPIHSNLVLVGCMNNSHRVVDYKRNAVVQEFTDHQKYVCCVRWAADGKHFFTASHDKTLNVYGGDASAASGKEAVSDQKSAASTAAAGASDAKVWTLKRSFPFVGAVECAVWLDNKTVLVAPRNDPFIHAIDVITFQEVGKYNMNARLDDHVSFTALDLVLSADGEFLAVPTDGHRVIVFRTRTTRQVRNLYGHTSDGFSNPHVVWSADGQFLYCTSQDLTVVAWDVATGKVIGKLAGHTNTLRDLAHHPSEELLLTCGFDKTIKLWCTSAFATANPSLVTAAATASGGASPSASTASSKK